MGDWDLEEDIINVVCFETFAQIVVVGDLSL
jgi:hypothetical protein